MAFCKVSMMERRCLALGMGLALLILSACSLPQKQMILKDMNQRYPIGTIVSGATGHPVTIDALVDDLAKASVIYIGEEHPNTAHHEIQLDLIRRLHKRVPDLAIGMEMFDFRYDMILDLWSAGEMERDSLIRKTHWYANWKWDYDLYADIFDYVRDNNIRLVGLNIPFHIPSRVRIGGMDGLLEDDRRYLPASVDLGNSAHRAYVEEIFNRHPHFKGDAAFDFFYEAQCVWEDTMAESVAGKMGDSPMVVLAGNGHIIKKFGIPDRAHSRSGAPFRTVYLARAGQEVELDYGDYLWVTP